MRLPIHGPALRAAFAVRRAGLQPRMDAISILSPLGAPVIGGLVNLAADQGVLSPAQASDVASNEKLSAAIAAAALAAVVLTVLRIVFERLVLPALLGGSSTSNSIDPFKFSLGKKLGGGNYGAVYLASEGPGGANTAVVKTASLTKDVNTKEFALAELYMNQKLKLCGQSGSCASFLGHYYAQSGSELALVFKNEGSSTLMDTLNGNFPENVADTILGRDTSGMDDEALKAAVVRRISKQVFSNLAGIHSWNVVHRDVKGANLILSEKDKKFKFIDFGVACDLVTGRNYNKDLQPFDPSYCPPEAPPIDKQGDGGLQLSAGGAFDVFSAGLLVVQMCFPNTRSDQGIKRFKMALDGCGYDLKEWRESLEGVRGYEEGFELLDAHGGWSLLQGCLKRQPSQRISAAAAASSGFCRV